MSESQTINGSLEQAKYAVMTIAAEKIQSLVRGHDDLTLMQVYIRFCIIIRASEKTLRSLDSFASFIDSL